VFSAGQMRCFQYTSSIARWEARRVSKLIVDDPLSTASRVGAPGAAVAESSNAATTIALGIRNRSRRDRELEADFERTMQSIQ